MKEHNKDSRAALELLKEHYGTIPALQIIKMHTESRKCSIPEACLELYKELERRK